MHRRFSNTRAGGWPAEDGVNPMEGVANLADAMLVLAVGAMLALIINWNIDIHPADTTQAQTDLDNAVTFTETDITPVDGQEQPSSDGMTKLGIVYYDEETDTYYIIGSPDGTGQSADQTGSD
jgi:hypothetical protein